MAEYLYGYGSKRHIRKPGGESKDKGRVNESMCGGWFDTEPAMEADMRRWNAGSAADKYIAERKALPLCRRCERAAEKAEQS